LAATRDDNRFEVFLQMSGAYNLTICEGVPTKQEHDVRISMLIFQSNISPKTYSKQLMHSD